MNILTLTDNTFEKEVLQSDIPVLVDFWAEWCQPCKMVGPIVEEVAMEYSGKIKVGKVNVDENTKTPSDYGIMSIPTLVIFKNGKPEQTMVGVQPKEVFKYHKGGYGHYSIVRWSFCILVNIYFADFNFAGIFPGYFLNNRPHHFTRLAPFCPEINKDRNITLKNFLFKCIVCEG